MDAQVVDLEQRIAELEEANLDAARTIAELRNQDALKTQFLANISHDLRTPLTAMITHAEILRDGILGPLTDRQHESVEGIIGGGRQLLAMVGEILTYARGAAGQLACVRSEFTVQEVIDQVRALSEPLIARRTHEWDFRIEQELPVLYADREKIAHVLANLLGNAMDFTPPGGRIWVHVGMSEDERGRPALRIEVGDTGIGIAREHHELIFREFAQVDASASRRHHGTGLGLAIARKFVELHDGRLWVESEPGRGSRFFFTIPLRARRDA
ncbi:MAG TPA: HAMP domain-containing sensor histidine kinase [Gemmatimonadaceae bacterium]|nr:HAMP domain-containing sensor histidine kinase [Gemmatimonadaceae bacterium]